MSVCLNIKCFSCSVNNGEWNYDAAKHYANFSIRRESFDGENILRFRASNPIVTDRQFPLRSWCVRI